MSMQQRLSSVGLLAVLLANTPLPQDVSFTPTEDAAVLREYPASNYSAGALSVEWEKFSIGNAVRRSFLRFETTGIEDLSFDCLTLKLTATSLGGGTTYFEVRQVTSLWNESDVKWESQPNVGGVLGNWTRAVGSGETIYIPLDTNALRTSGTFDIALVGHTYGGTSQVEFESREGLSPPELILGCSSAPLRAGFAIRVPEGPAPLLLSFENVSHGMATSWAWDFGDGSSSSVKNPTHTYVAPGRYSVGLTITDPGGSDTHTRENYVFAYPPDTPLGEVVSWLKISQISGGPILEDQDMFGRSVASLGDLDGDGVPDVIVGAVGDDDAPLEGGGDLPGTLDDNRGFNPGAAYILFMNADGSVRQHQKISNLYGGFQALLEDVDGFGRYVAGIGDLDGDGVVDVAIAATRDDDGGLDRGAIYILFLNSDGTVKAETKISDTQGGFTADLENDDQFGRGITSLGDLDGDGVQDLATGATGDDDGGIDRGCVYILFMNRDGTVKSHSKISELEGGLQTAWVGFWFGMDVDCLGDVDGDGVNDLAVGVLLDQAVPAASGAAFVLLLNPDGTVKGESFINAFNGLLTGELEADDEFGGAVAGIGDLDGDGIPDLAVGSIRDDDNSKGELEITLDYGAGYIFFLNADGSVREYQKISETRGNFDAAFDKYVRFCEGLGSAGDFDGDGWVDLWSGSRFDRDGGPNNGAIYLLKLRGATLGPVVAGMHAAPSLGEVPLTVGFFDRSSGAINSWDWDFGDGSSSAQKNPVHHYTSPGTYSVTLTSQGAAGMDTLIRTALIVVTPPLPPIAAFAVTPETGPMPLTVAFSDQSEGTLSSWSWDFGDGSGASTANPSHTYAMSGTYSVELTVSGPTGGDTLVRTNAVVVGLPGPPGAAFGGVPLLGDVPLQVFFQDASTGHVSGWLWDFGDGSQSSAQTPTHVYVLPGTYDVSLSVNGLGGNDSATTLAFVNVGGEVAVGLGDGSFEAQIGGGSPSQPWTLVAGQSHRVGPLGLPEDGGMPVDGVQWLEVSAAGSFDATPPGFPGGIGHPAVGASCVAQAFRLPPGQTRLSFGAEFLLAGPASSSAFNDWMSVDISDGERTLNLYYVDSFTPLPDLSVEHGLPMTSTARVDFDLIHAFPLADADTVFTLKIQVGNGGDGAGASIGRVDGFRLEASDPSIGRLGCGVNPVGSLLVLEGAPLLGTSMRYGIDNPLGTQSPGAFPAFFVALNPDGNHPCGSSFSGIGMSGGAGEMLIGLLPSDLAAVFGGSPWGGVGSPSRIEVSLPSLPALTGLTVYAQGLLYDGGANAAVRIGMTDGLELSLSFLPASGLANLGLGKSAVQSSDFGGTAVASRAIDGSIDGDFLASSVSQTLKETDPYWEVDLEAVYSLEWIDIWNRTDCCSRRLEGAFVFVSDVPFVSSVASEVQAQAGVFSFEFSEYHDTFNRVPVGRTGRYVRVQQFGERYVQLAEVEIIGFTSPGSVRNAGLAAQYFDNMDLTGLALERIDAQVDFDFALDSPAPELQPDTFSVRWKGFLLPPATETFTFTVESSDGVRLWVDGQRVIDSWFDRSFGESTGAVDLETDEAVPIVLEYFENTGDAVVRLFWASGTVEKQIVPGAALSRWGF